MLAASLGALWMSQSFFIWPAWSAHLRQELPEQGDPAGQTVTQSLEDAIEQCESGVLSDWACADRLNGQLKDLEGSIASVIRRRSSLNLVRRAKLLRLVALEHSGQKDEALRLMTDLVSVSPLTQDELLELGPTLASEASRTRARIEARGNGVIQVRCRSACIVAINDVLVDNPAIVPIGVYRVTVSGIEQSASPLIKTIAVTQRGQKRSLDYQPPALKPKPSAEQPSSEPEARIRETIAFKSPMTVAEGPVVAPLIPRKALRVGMVAALATAATGGFLWSMDERCKTRQYQGVLPNGDALCKPGQTWGTKHAGIAVLSVGAVGLLAGAVMLGVERARGKGKEPLRLPKGAKEQSVARTRFAPRYRNRHFPRWFELSGMGLGLAGIVSGGILLGFDGKRVPGKSFNYDNRPHALGLIVAGAQFLAFSSIFLAIDEWPRAKKRRSVSFWPVLKF